ncbi:MAG: hypothetical protein QM778_23800 [Myxococcales bacterium]
MTSFSLPGAHDQVFRSFVWSMSLCLCLLSSSSSAAAQVSGDPADIELNSQRVQIDPARLGELSAERAQVDLELSLLAAEPGAERMTPPLIGMAVTGAGFSAMVVAESIRSHDFPLRYFAIPLAAFAASGTVFALRRAQYGRQRRRIAELRQRRYQLDQQISNIECAASDCNFLILRRDQIAALQQQITTLEQQRNPIPVWPAATLLAITGAGTIAALVGFMVIGYSGSASKEGPFDGKTMGPISVLSVASAPLAVSSGAWLLQALRARSATSHEIRELKRHRRQLETSITPSFSQSGLALVFSGRF